MTPESHGAVKSHDPVGNGAAIAPPVLYSCAIGEHHACPGYLVAGKVLVYCGCPTCHSLAGRIGG